MKNNKSEIEELRTKWLDTDCIHKETNSAICLECINELINNSINQGILKAKDDFKENLLMTKSNHQLGCMLECYEEVICNRIGFEKEAKQLLEIASRLK